MKNQVRLVCSPKDKIWSQTDKLQRCRRLPLEQAKLKQILENNREGVLIRKWFDRWYVAQTGLCDRLRGKIDNVLISQRHESRRGRQYFPYEMGQQFPEYPPGWICPITIPYIFNGQEELPAHLLLHEFWLATLTAWCDVLFAYFVLKCDCSFPDNIFVTGRFEVRFVLNKSEIAL